MPVVNLLPFSYKAAPELEGEILLQRVAGRPLVFLFDEDHVSAQGIAASLRNALKLIDNGIVNFIGVEETPEGVRENAERLPTTAFKHKYESLEAYAASLREHFSGNDAATIDAESRKPDFRFGKILLFLRPKIKICSVDNIELCRIAQAEYCRLLQKFDPDTPEGRMAASRRFSAHRIHRQRDRMFAERLLKFYREADASGAIVLNAGGNHNERIVPLLPKDASIIRIRPPGYRGNQNGDCAK